jgi:hypothetical protein
MNFARALVTAPMAPIQMSSSIASALRVIVPDFAVSRQSQRRGACAPPVWAGTLEGTAAYRERIAPARTG